ncbi:MAG: ThuA domain-containing protein [Candidatus Solibacter sp.]|nr:ThuA domain-containing protein [Candidatus Solibacter sp.]
MTIRQWQLMLAAGVAGLALSPGTGNAQDWAQIRTGAVNTVFFRVAVPVASFREMRFLEAVDRIAPLRVPNIEASSTQKTGGGIAKPLAPGLSSKEINVVKGALRNRKIVAYSIPSIPSDEAAARELFEFAKALNVETIISEPAAGALPLIDRLAAEFNIRVALVHPDPKALRKMLDGRGDKIGAYADFAGAAALQDRLFAVRLTGARAADWKDLFLALYRQKVRSAIYTFEPTASGEALTDLSAKLQAYETALTPVMSEYVSELGRSAAIRTVDAQTRLTVEQKAEAKQKMDAAIPAHPQAKPRKARKLLVIDLQVGYPGHPSIPYANYVLEQYGKRTGAWEATFSNDLANFQYAKLRQYDAIFLNNTVGMLFADPEVRSSIVRFLQEGGGLAGYHASTHASIDWPEFTEIIGASSGAHREATERVTVKLDDPASAINAAFGGQAFESIDEHFRWSNYSRQRVHVLLSIDVPKTDLNQGRGCDICTRADGDYAISWIRGYGKGRVFYSSLGHAPTALMDNVLVRHFMAGVQFALGDLDADTAPGNRPAGQ